MLLCYQQQTCNVKIARIPARTRNVAEHLLWVIQHCIDEFNDTAIEDFEIINEIDAFKMLIGLIYESHAPNVLLQSWQKESKFCAFPWNKDEHQQYYGFIRHEDTNAYPTTKKMLNEVFDCLYQPKASGVNTHFFGFLYGQMFSDFFTNMDSEMSELLEKYFTLPGMVDMNKEVSGDNDHFLFLNPKNVHKFVTDFRKLLSNTIKKDTS